MNTSIIIYNYLVDELKKSQTVANKNLEELSNHKEIKEELTFWIVNRRFPEHAVSVLGYTAQKLCESTYLTPLGAYNFLVFLSEDPETALADLHAGLPKK